MKKPVLDVVVVVTVLLFFSANAWAQRAPVPDGGSSALLVGLSVVALGALGVVRRFLR